MLSSFFGCLYAGVLAIPAYPPRNNRNMLRIDRIVNDAKPEIVMTTSKIVSSITAPNQTAQVQLLTEAYQKANVPPEKVQYIETHGTGTSLGDPSEVGALSQVVSLNRSEDRKCKIGSVKSNIGHLESAAGIAGLIKTALAINKRCLPAGLHFKHPNPHIPFHDIKVSVQDSLTS